jgi:hypothetical protein
MFARATFGILPNRIYPAEVPVQARWKRVLLHNALAKEFVFRDRKNFTRLTG